MSAAHLHLVLNHFPLFGELAALVLVAAGTLFRKRDLVTAALVTAIGTGALAVATFYSGRAAAEVIGSVEGIDQEAIGPHEEIAELFTLSAIVTATFAGSALRWPRALPLVGLAIVASLGLGLLAAERGGKIHHPEVLHQGRQQGRIERPSNPSASSIISLSTGDPESWTIDPRGRPPMGMHGTWSDTNRWSLT